MTVGVVILDLNQNDTTLRCLQSVEDGDVCPEVVVLVENGDSRVSRNQLEELERTMDIVVLRPNRNLGCAGGRNLGLNYLAANTDVSTYIVLDNDTVVPKEFIATVKATPLGNKEVIAPVIKDLNKDTIWSIGGAVESDGTIEQFTTHPEPNRPFLTVDWSPGACLIMNRDTWEDAGEFDDWMNFFFADIEWCLRVAELGGEIVIHPNLQIEHEGHLSLGGEQSPTRTRFWARNGTLFRLDMLGVGPGASLKWILGQFKKSLSELVTGRFGHSKARIRGLTEGLHESIQRHRGQTRNHR